MIKTAYDSACKDIQHGICKEVVKKSLCDMTAKYVVWSRKQLNWSWMKSYLQGYIWRRSPCIVIMEHRKYILHVLLKKCMKYILFSYCEKSIICKNISINILPLVNTRFKIQDVLRPTEILWACRKHLPIRNSLRNSSISFCIVVLIEVANWYYAYNI